MQCSVCGTSNTADAAFCITCGSALTAPRPATGATVNLNRPPQSSEPPSAPRIYEAPPSAPAPPTFTPGAQPNYMPGAQPYIMPSGMMPQTNSMAVASLVLSVLSFFLLPLIGAIIGIVLGYRARNEIRGSNGQQSGDGLATAGIIVGWISIGMVVLGAIGICLLFAIGASMQ